MNQIHLARALGILPSSTFQRIQNDWLINSIEPHVDVTFKGKGFTAEGNSTTTKDVAEAREALAHRAGVNCIAIDNNDGRYLLSGGADAAICLWDLDADELNSNHHPAASLSRSSPNSHTHAITAISVYPFDPTPSTLITASYDKSVKLVALTASSLEPIHSFALEHAPYTIALSQLSSAHPLVAVGTAHPATRLLDLRSGLGTHSLPGHNGGVYSISWSPKYDYILASGATDGRVLFFDIRRANAAFGSLDLDDAVGVIGEDPRTGLGARKTPDWSGRAHVGPVTGVQWTSNGEKLVTCGHDQRIRVFDMATGKNDLVHFGPRIRNSRSGALAPLISPPGFTRPSRELVFWPNDDGKGDIYVHSLREGDLIRVLSTPGVERVTQSQGKKDSISRLTSGGRVNGLVWRFNAASGNCIELYSAHGDGRICKWSALDESNTSENEAETDDGSQNPSEKESRRKRKQDMVGELIASLSNKSMRL